MRNNSIVNSTIDILQMKFKIVQGEKFFYTISFDIDDFIGDGIWWIEIFNVNGKMICDKPFASSDEELDIDFIENIIKEEIFSYQSEAIL
ncbi:MAG TPA: hypothetical protein DCR71_00470 [Dehalococcoidia bacterium]|jgi:hypothetical protein|nr:hypothetical protein [Dehalococcoidia bacterium]